MREVLTGNYKNCTKGNIISISGDKGKRAKYIGMSMTELAPKKEFWTIWHNNIGNISEEENNLYYIREFYNQVLRYLNPEDILNKLPNLPILLCYEDNMEFCHRHLVAFWFELFLDITTSEVRVNPKRETLTKLQRPEYLRELLEYIIKETYNMNGYNSIRAAYLSNKIDEFEKIGKEYDIKALRMQIDEAESNYKRNSA